MYCTFLCYTSLLSFIEVAHPGAVLAKNKSLSLSLSLSHSHRPSSTIFRLCKNEAQFSQLSSVKVKNFVAFSAWCGFWILSNQVVGPRPGDLSLQPRCFKTSSSTHKSVGGELCLEGPYLVSYLFRVARNCIMWRSCDNKFAGQLCPV